MGDKLYLSYTLRYQKQIDLTAGQVLQAIRGLPHWIAPSLEACQERFGSEWPWGFPYRAGNEIAFWFRKYCPAYIPEDVVYQIIVEVPYGY